MKLLPLVLMLAFPAVGFSQTPHAAPPEGQMVIRKDGDAMKALTKELNLTPDQAKKVGAIRKLEMAELMKNRATLTPEKAQKIFHSHDPELKKILSKEQFAKLDAMRSRMKVVHH